MSLTSTLAPRAASNSACARPRLGFPPAPVTIAVRPSNLNSVCEFMLPVVRFQDVTDNLVLVTQRELVIVEMELPDLTGLQRALDALERTQILQHHIAVFDHRV